MHELKRILALTAWSLALSNPALADTVKWSFSGVKFAGGDTASGSFVVSDGVMSDVNITVLDSSGNTKSVFKYWCENRCPGQSDRNVLAEPVRPDLSGIEVLNLDQTIDPSHPTNEYLIVGFKGTCIDPDCHISQVILDGIPITHTVPLIREQGQTGPTPPVLTTSSVTSVPTLNQWGIALLTFLMGGLTFWRQRRNWQS